MKKKSERSDKYRLLFGSDTERGLLPAAGQRKAAPQERLPRKILIIIGAAVPVILVLIFIIRAFIPSTVPIVYPPKTPLKMRPLHPGGLTVENINNQFGQFDGTAPIGVNGVVPGRLVLSQQQIPNQDVLAAEFGVTPAEISRSAPVAQNGLPLPPEIVGAGLFSAADYKTASLAENNKIPVTVKIYPFFNRAQATGFILKIRNTLPVLFEGLQSTVTEKAAHGQKYFQVNIVSFPNFVAADNFCSRLGPISYNYSCTAQAGPASAGE